MRLKFKKGDGLSMNVVIIAILALLVLVILAVIFITQMNKNTNVQNSLCRLESISAQCVDTSITCESKGLTPGKGVYTDCPANEAKRCCVPGPVTGR